jgi:hypothetical protein
MPAPDEHYLAAEDDMDHAYGDVDAAGQAFYLARAQIHATLALFSADSWADMKTEANDDENLRTWREEIGD